MDISSIRMTNTFEATDMSNMQNFTTIKASHFLKKGNKMLDLDYFSKSEMTVRQQAIQEIEGFEAEFLMQMYNTDSEEIERVFQQWD